MNKLPFRRYTVVALTAFVLLLSGPTFAQNEAPRIATESDAEAALSQGKPASAIAIYNNLITQSPKRFKLYLGRGLSYFHAKQFSKAVLDFTSFIKLRPALIEGYQNRAYAYKEMGKYKEALADLDTVESIRPNDKNANRLREDILKLMPTP